MNTIRKSDGRVKRRNAVVSSGFSKRSSKPTGYERLPKAPALEGVDCWTMEEQKWRWREGRHIKQG
jgi:hypothetical protein